jgi:ribose transport system substrate-binding protein
MKRSISIFLVIILAAFAFSGCSSSSATSEEPAAAVEQTEEATAVEAGSPDKHLEIVYIFGNASASSQQRAKEGLLAYIEKNNWDWNVAEMDSAGSGEALAANIEDAVQRGVDGIIVAMTDMRAAKAALEDAQKAGIPVYSIDSGWTEGLVVDVTSNNYVMSAKVSSYLVDRLGGEGNIVAFKMAEHHGVRKRGEVLDIIASESPGITIIEDHNIDYTNFYDDTMKSMEDFLSKHGKDIDAVWAGWDEPAMAAAAAIEARGYTRDDMFVTGIDGHDSAIQQIVAGSPLSATVAQGFEVMSEKIADIIYRTAVMGESFDTVVPTTTIYVDTPLITDANLPAEGVPAYLAPDFYSK